ncbi:acyl-homoserine-lactone acylase [Pseudoduganella lurida]|uniref:Acyl-homoserine-lactone acylase n=1 Tax=Pseudoduganella lurida TaxID=1036180 RepID=A0A562QU19_9BURK|nr:penicillin acylase family protein [Pseudoduganella lurida]TWI60272.1 acyl-homoserine-lactone acylase [Pseudoduganella lurida]
MRKVLLMLLVSTLFLLASCGDHDDHEAPPRASTRAELTRTAYGVLHVRADDFAGLGMGLAYAYAQDNVCMLADTFLTVRGERSRYFGGDAKATSGADGEYSVSIDYLDQQMFELRNEDSDFFFKAYLDLPRLRAGYAAGSSEVTALLQGYVAGYNRYVREHAGDLPAACRGAAWVRPITVDDMYLLVAEKALHASGEVFAGAVLAAARGAEGGAGVPATSGAPWPNNALGSNAVAVGRDVTADGRGMLLANPHYPWFSTDRFYQVHLTIPGVYDAMGASLGGLPIVVIGFNKDVAWTHTVTRSTHFTTFRLPLDAGDPAGLTYLVDGAPRRMTERVVDVEVLQADGTLATHRRVFRDTLLGMVMAIPDVPVGPDGVLVLGDPNRDNTRLLQQWIALGKADSVQSLQAALGRVLGLPWVNTLAADRQGNALFADYSVIPHMPASRFASSCLLFAPLLLFDGSRSACHWGRDPGAPPGIFAGSSAPAMLRTDYVANSNDSYWLTNTGQLLTGPGEGYSPLYGPVGVEQHLRTRLGFLQLDQRLAQPGKIGPGDLQALLFSNRVHAAELVLPDLLEACKGGEDAALAASCSVLAAWDRKADLDSAGAVLFREFWLRASQLTDRWAVPFDAADPVHTPRGIADSAKKPMLAALAAAARRLQSLGIPLDARLGNYQADARGGAATPVHGGIGDVDGVYNALHMATDLTALGYGNVVWGTSYIQLVGFDAQGPVAQGLLAYGQSTDPRSEHHADQLPMYSAKTLVPLPFTAEQVRAAGIRSRIVLVDENIRR